MKKFIVSLSVGLLGLGFWFGVIKGEYAQGTFYLTFCLICIVATKTDE